MNVGAKGAEVVPLVLARIRAQLAAGETPTFTAAGHSMWPTLRDGDTVAIEPLPPAGPRLGDIVLAVTPGGLVLHRVIALSPGRALLKGDARPRPDGWCHIDSLAGRLSPAPLGPLRAALTRATGPCLARALGLLRRAEARLPRRA